jgi:hypothetical protein
MIGEITEKTQFFKHENFVDINEDLFFDAVAYPDLFNGHAPIAFEQVITDPSNLEDERFGWVTAIYEDTLVIGASYAKTGSFVQPGAAYVYIRSGSTWTLQQTLTNPTPANEDHFGWSVSLYLNTLVIGTTNEDTGASNAGACYVYVRQGTTWALQQTITNPTPTTDDAFGNSVSLYQDTLVVGAERDDTGATDAGSVYVYFRSGSTWTLQQTINNPVPIIYDRFGYSLVLYNDTLAVGAPNANIGATDSGSVRIYTRTNGVWTLQQTISNPLPAVSDHFGYSVSLYGDTLVIGTPEDDTTKNWAGSVYIYNRSGSTWTLQQAINNPNLETGSAFGNSVSLYDKTLVVAAYYDSLDESYGEIYDTGAINVYNYNNGVWSLVQRIANPDFITEDNFGWNVCLYDNTISVGVPFKELYDKGVTYIYRAVPGGGFIPARATDNPTTRYFIQVK